MSIDTNERSQVNTSGNRTMYDANGFEIFGKSLLAGFGLGLGSAIATLIFFGIVVGLLLVQIEPILAQYFPAFSSSMKLLEQTTTPTKNSPSPTPTTRPTSTT